MERVRAAARAPGRWRYALLALIVYVPLLLGAIGRVGADTKQYLYLDPGGLLDKALSLWDPTFGGGTVTHQTIGYLWPMGPYYWVTNTIGLPDWIAQRIWIGSIIFAAAAGALFLLDRLLTPRTLNLVGALVYGLSPYVLGHVTGQSPMLLSWSALPWLVVMMGRSTLAGGWRWPAAYALIVTSCGSLNGSSVFFVVLGSSLFVPFLVASHEEVSWGRALGALLRCGFLTLVTQLWWLIAYAVGGGYGMPILEMTETIDTTSSTSSATEVLRGLGYWFSYGRDVGGLWLSNLIPLHTELVVALAASFVVPVAAMVAGATTRWAHRAYFAALSVVGLVMAVGAYSTSAPSLYGRVWTAAANSSELVFSLRNSQRATPLLLLGLAGLLTAGLHALGSVRLQWMRVAGALVVVAVVVAFPSFWATGLVAERFDRPEDLPDHWYDTADALAGTDGRVLEMPGIDFGAYRWGNTLDPVLPGLSDRPENWRELIPWGTAPGVDLLGALDRSMQEGTFEPEMLAPTARLLGISDLVVRNDLEYERYRTVRPRVLWDELTPTPDGLDDPERIGEGYVNQAVPSLPMIDEVELGIDPSVENPPAVAIFGVQDAPELVRLVPTDGGTIISGSGEGILAAIAGGVLEVDGSGVRYSAELTREPGELDDALGPDTALVITDSNRLRAHHWYSLRENVGATEPPGVDALDDDLGDARVPPVADGIDESYTTVEYRGAQRVWASSYGNNVTLVPESRAFMAFDGDTRTEWTTSTSLFQEAAVIGIDLDAPSDADHIVLRQPLNRPGSVIIDSVEVRLDGGRPITVELDERSRSLEGQRVDLDGEPFSSLEVELLDRERGIGPSGFASIDIPGVEVEEVVHLPTDLTDAVGADAADHPFAIVMARQRVNPADVVRSDPETTIVRAFELPAALQLGLSGTARLSDDASDTRIDELLGIPSAAEGGMTADSRERLGGDLGSRASSAFDGDPTTSWQSPFGDQEGVWVEMTNGAPFTIDTLALDVVADGRHSVPSQVTLQVDGGDPVVVDLPEIEDLDELWATQHVEVPLAEELTGSTLRVVVSGVAERTTIDWYSNQDIALPVGIAEMSIPGVARPEPSADLDGACRDDLVSIDGTPVPVRVEGSTDDAVDGQPLSVSGCEPTVGLDAGERVVRTADGADLGIDVDRLVLSSAPDGAASAGVPETGAVAWERPSRTAVDITIEPAGDDPVWVVVSESWSRGWHASIDGEDLGEPTIQDGYGFGWLITPDGSGDPIEIELRWTPQRVVVAALGTSIVAVLACLALIGWGRRRRDPVPDLRGPVPVIDVGPLRFGWPAVVLAAVLGTVLVSLLVGALLGLVAAVVLARPGWSRWARLIPAACVGLAGAYVVALQIRWGYTTDFFWPRHFTKVHRLALAGPILLGILVWCDRHGRDTTDPLDDRS